ncbi:MAG TPA: hypothetical protein VHK67_06800 [Rhabdochlamydiaceae bacterium]|jgi:hypothetical protein|nr:hypothetical protein [Rhabdochlamydiaceae bacterium]
MTSVQNLSKMGSLALHTLTEGSTTERLLLGGAAAAIGIVILVKIYTVACKLFAKAQTPYVPPSLKLPEDTRKKIAEKVKLEHPVTVLAPIPIPAPASSIVSPQHQSHSVVTSLTINDELVTSEKEAQLADALHAYHKLKTNTQGEDGFVFLTEQYLQNSGLPSIVVWKEKELQFKDTAGTNADFVDLDRKLRQVGLSLKDVKRSERVIAQAYFSAVVPKDIHSISELYEIVRLQAPHILGSYVIESKKQQIEKGKEKLHAMRLNIVDKTLSTLSDVFLKDLVKDFQQKHPELVAIFGSNPETLQFLVKNICWHALDRSLELIETNLIPSKEKQQDALLADYKSQLGKVMKDKDKRDQAQLYLVQILISPNDEAMNSLIALLQAEEVSEARDELIRKVQAPELTSEEEAATQKLERSESVLGFYHVVDLFSGALEKGKVVFLSKKEAARPFGPTIERIPPKEEPPKSREDREQTYADQIGEVSTALMKAGENAVQAVAGQQWDQAHATLEQELKKIPNLTAEMCGQIVAQGWTDFQKNREALYSITGQQRWLITKKMIASKLARGSLQMEGKKLLREVGKKATSFIKTLLGRGVNAFLAFDQRTREAGLIKPADKIAETLIDSVSECHQALTRVKNSNARDRGGRENAVIKALTKDLHPQASNTPSADTVFVGKLTYQFLSILQPKGLQEDFQKALISSMTKPETEEVSTISKLLGAYNQKIRPVIGPWLKPVGGFLFQALENIIEKQSTSNIVKQLSDVIDPVTLNAALVTVLMPDLEKIYGPDEQRLVIESNTSVKMSGKWYSDDEEEMIRLLLERSAWEAEIKALEEQLELQNKAAADIEKGKGGIIQKNQELAQKNQESAASELKALEKQLELQKKVHADIEKTKGLINQKKQGITEPEIKALEEQLGSLQKTAADIEEALGIINQKKQDLAQKKQESGALEIKALEKQAELEKKVKFDLENTTQAIIKKKQDLAALELKLAPTLLRRRVIEVVPFGLVSYVLEFAADLFELAQYPRILRHVVFNILEKTVESLATSLNEIEPEEAERLLQLPITATETLSVFDFLFTARLKNEFGNGIKALFWSINPTDKSWFGSAAQVGIQAFSGSTIFSGLQKAIESLITEKFKTDQAVKWSGAKMAVAINNKLLAFANDPGKDGMAAAITGRLQLIVGIKEAAAQSVPTSTNGVALESNNSTR